MPFKDPENLWILMLSLEHGVNQLSIMKHSLYETKHACQLVADSLQELYGPELGVGCTKEYNI